MKSLREEAPLWARTLPQLPRLLHRSLARDDVQRIETALRDLERSQQRQARLLRAIALLLALLVIAYLAGL